MTEIIYKDYFNARSKNEEAQKELIEQHKALKETRKRYDESESHVQSLQSVGQIVGEVLTKMSSEKFIVKTLQGPRYVVGIKSNLESDSIKSGTRVALDLTTLTIMKALPREVDPAVFMMSEVTTSDVDFAKIGGLQNEIRDLREIVELPIKNPEIFKRIGIAAPKGVLLYGPPGTGKTLIAKAVANVLDVHFMKIVASGLIEKYIGESSRMIREMFSHARACAPCIIFLDEIDAIGGKRTTESSSSDREVQRTLMELLNQLDGFKDLEDVKVIMATNRPDILDPALLRPGRLDRKIEIPLPNDFGRKEILKIHSTMEKGDEIDYNLLVKLTHGCNGADLRNVCTEAGMFALREERDFVLNDDFVKAVRKIMETKKLESKMAYKRGFGK